MAALLMGPKSAAVKHADAFLESWIKYLLERGVQPHMDMFRKLLEPQPYSSCRRMPGVDEIRLVARTKSGDLVVARQPLMLLVQNHKRSESAKCCSWYSRGKTASAPL